MPDRIVRKALIEAVIRGVDVRVLVPARSDVVPVFYAGRRLYERLLRGGVKLYAWKPSVLHSKTAVTDDIWSTLGTHNLDNRSWQSNLEVNVAIEDPTTASAMRRRFEQDIEQSEHIVLAQWQKRPWTERLLERFFYLFRALL